ncbi:MAG: M1 family metallopeptidase [Bacteroidetes bacterium]|nr:M1 family metallopeptidase [Bacteroidota bacterium]MDA1121037.1 M1 family metallopeptidase [Bacteroidota bacterium]
MMRVLLLTLSIISFVCSGQIHQKRWDEIDVQHYKFQLELSDVSNEIKGNAEVKIRFKKSIDQVILDLVSKTEMGGMLVSQVLFNGQKAPFEHTGAKLKIQLPDNSQINSEATLSIIYSGVPVDGLIISKNLFGNRTFFGDNYPDRAQNWLPVVDHPSDKATVEFLIIAPNHYQVISNGIQIEETDLSDDLKFTHWSDGVELPTKEITIGVSNFATQLVENVGGIPVYTWVYPENRVEGFYDFSIAPSILKYLIEKIGDYPYDKLANVQSRTRFGGAENANTIFYNEKIISGTQASEFTVAHEIAHQWFGNSVTEANWHHVWLSEGFATYFENLWAQHTEREDIFRMKMIEDRVKLIKYSKIKLAPIVDTSVVDYMKILNPNTYEKAAWVLHMLRDSIGDDAFFSGIRQYYDEYKFSNVLTEDFMKVMERVSGISLESFFDQWFYKSGHPILSISTAQKKSMLVINIEQKQTTEAFEFPLEIELEVESGLKVIKKVIVKQNKETYKFEIDSKVIGVTLDPDIKLLFESFN